MKTELTYTLSKFLFEFGSIWLEQKQRIEMKGLCESINFIYNSICVLLVLKHIALS